MKAKSLILTAITALAVTVTVNPCAAEEPQRPVLEAAHKATPRQRMEAADFFRTAYPGLPQDMYSNLKATYPELEHGVVDAALSTWKQHPGELLAIAEEVRAKFGPRLKSLRTQARHNMEASYPNFRERLQEVLSQHGPAARWVSFMEGYDPGLLENLRSNAKKQRPGWYPGKFRKMWATAKAGETPVFDALLGFVKKNPELGPQAAAKAVEMTRSRAPGLAEDVTKQFLRERGRLREALQVEFPGGREVMLSTIESHDPELPGEVARFVRSKTVDLRADLRTNLESELPGFEAKVEELLSERYPDLRAQLLARLK